MEVIWTIAGKIRIKCRFAQGLIMPVRAGVAPYMLKSICSPDIYLTETAKSELLRAAHPDDTLGVLSLFTTPATLTVS